jgi:hypothetical protein
MARRLLLTLAILAGFSNSSADNQAFGNLIAMLKRHAGDATTPISLSAVGSAHGRNLDLKFTLTNVSTKTLTMFPTELPWGNAYAITWAALTGDGQVLPVGYPIDDPFPAETISVAPHQSLTGTYHLSRMLDLEKVPADTDIAVVWVYYLPAGPVEGKGPRPFCTGITLVHTLK